MNKFKKKYQRNSHAVSHVLEFSGVCLQAMAVHKKEQSKLAWLISELPEAK